MLVTAMENIVVKGLLISGWTLQTRSSNLRRALITNHELSENPAEGPDSPPQPISGGGPGGGGRSDNGSTMLYPTLDPLDPEVMTILLIFLSVVICAACLHSIMRWVKRRWNRDDNPPEESQAVQGLDDKALAALPVLPFRGAQFEKLKDGSPVECPICLSDLAENERVRLLPKCNHVFHIECIDMWLLSNVSCPVCRGRIVDIPKLLSSAIVVVEEQSDSPVAAHNIIGVELLQESGASSIGGALVVNPSSPGGNGSAQDVAALWGRRGRRVRASLSSMFAAESMMMLFISSFGPAPRGRGPAASSSASTS